MKTQTKITICALIIAALLFNGRSAFSQDAIGKRQASDWTIGVMGGTNLSQLILGSKDINKDYQFSFGYNAGFTASYRLNKYLSLVAEPMFVDASSESKGFQPILPNSPLQSDHDRYANYKKTERFTYVELPVMLRITTGDKIKYYANVGPYAGALLDARMETSGNSLLYLDKNGLTPEPLNGSNHSIDQAYNNTSNVETFNLGVTAGVGTGYTLGRHGILLEARYNIGLLNIRSYSSFNGQNNLQTIMLNLGYTYNLPE